MIRQITRIALILFVFVGLPALAKEPVRATIQITLMLADNPVKQRTDIEACAARQERNQSRIACERPENGQRLEVSDRSGAIQVNVVSI